MSRTIRLLALFSLVLSGFAFRAEAAEARQPLWEPLSVGAGSGGTYYLTRDIVSSSGPAVEINGTGVEDVVIDLNGFRIEGPGGASAIEIDALRSFTMRNGKVSCAAGGFSATRILGTLNVVVEDVEFSGCNGGLTISDATSFAVRRNVVIDAIAGQGIWIGNFSAPYPGRGVVDGNTVRVDASFGIRIENGAESEGVTISNNRVEAAIAGIVARGNGYLISGNIVTRGGGDGIWIVAGVTGCRVVNNVVSANDGVGILVSNASSCQIRDNVIYENTSDGIRIEDASKIILDHNLLTDNGGAGLKLLTTASDVIYRDNVARGNAFASGACAGNPPACSSPDICDDGGTGNVSGGDNYLPGAC